MNICLNLIRKGKKEKKLTECTHLMAQQECETYLVTIEKDHTSKNGKYRCNKDHRSITEVTKHLLKKII